jgi:hypothetical protein
MREGGCRCGAVRYAVDGPLRDVLVCHCGACRSAAGRPWAATAAHRADLTLAERSGIRWALAAVSEHDASRGSCERCGTVVFWDAPGRDTVSIGVDTLDDASGLEVAAHIWAGPDGGPGTDASGAVFPRGLPAGIDVPWRRPDPPEAG